MEIKKPEEIDLGFKLNDSLLRDIDLPIEEISLSELIYNADIPYLERQGTDDWNLSPNELIRNFDKESNHASKVGNVDMQYPICIYYFKNHWIVLDGVHRFTKALMNKDKTIKVKRISNKMMG